MSHKITQVATYHIRSPRPNRLFVYLIIKQRLMINPVPTLSRKTRPWGLNQDTLGGIQKRTAIRDATCSWEDSNFSSHRTQLPDNHRQIALSKQAFDPLSATNPTAHAPRVTHRAATARGAHVPAAATLAVARTRDTTVVRGAASIASERRA